MRWRETVTPVPMSRVALVTPEWTLRHALVIVADAGIVELDRTADPADLPASEAVRSLQKVTADSGTAPAAALTVDPLPVRTLEESGRADLLAGEVQLAERQADAVVKSGVAGWTGWVPTNAMASLNLRLAPAGAVVVALERPRGLEPPTATRTGGVTESFAPLVRTYTTVPYRDLDPTVLAGLAYLVMFGVMFGDAGHGALLALAGLLARLGKPRLLRRLRSYWLFITGAGLSAMIFGFAYGEFFGPTGVIDAAWLSPMDDPVRLLLAGIGLGAILLAGAYALGSINRVREGGWMVALYAPSGLAGSMLFLAAGLGLAAWYFSAGWIAIVSGLLGFLGLGLSFAGLLAASGGGGAGAVQAVTELVDLVIRLGANVVSFARLAAFGLTHAVLGWVIWTATIALWHMGWLAGVIAVLVFAIGNAVAFGLEALVAGIQALRLEYYELFSRVFQLEGRPFRPWHVPTAVAELKEVSS